MTDDPNSDTCAHCHEWERSCIPVPEMVRPGARKPQASLVQGGSRACTHSIPSPRALIMGEPPQSVLQLVG